MDYQMTERFDRLDAAVNQQKDLVYVSFRANSRPAQYQSEHAEEGMWVPRHEAAPGRDMVRALALHRVGKRIGLRRSELDTLSQHFYGQSWASLTGGVEKGDEVL